MTGLIDFSTDAASNDVAAPPILWIEGQPAKTVNDSARAFMAALACWRDDNTGALSAIRGGADAYQLATAQGFSSAAAARAHTVRFRVGTANTGGAATLSVDGNSAKPLLRGKLRPVSPGDLSPGIVYSAAYVPAEGAYLIIAPDFETPGTIKALAHTAVDPGWLICDGRAVSRTVYAALFAVLGTTWGDGNGTTTFNLPKTNGRALFGADDLGGTAANVLTGTGGLNGALGSSGGTQAVVLTAAQNANHTHTGTTGAAGGHDHGGTTNNGGGHDHGGATQNAGGHSHTGTTDSGGAHTHTGSTATAGSHTHNIKYKLSGPVSGGPDLFVVTQIDMAGANNNTDAAGDHTHSLTVDSGGSHQHNFTTAGVGDHAHGITAAPAHSHTITAAPDHTHTLTTSASGAGEAHPNVPPGLVVAFAIKT